MPFIKSTDYDSNSLPFSIFFPQEQGVEASAVEQMNNCLAPEESVAGTLSADHHQGYSAPIGATIAYRDAISPSGVGFDIGCIAQGEVVLTSEGYHLPIERLTSSASPVRPGQDGAVSPIAPYLTTVDKGIKPVLTLSLADGRSVTLTHDHEVRTKDGWVRADELTTEDSVLCPAFTGLPYEECEYSAAFLRLAGYINGDGHITKEGKRAVIYTSKAADVEHIVRDVVAETGYTPATAFRIRPNGSHEHAIIVDNIEFARALINFGCPSGQKKGNWPKTLEPTLLTLPAWARAQYLSGFFGAEGTTPVYTDRNGIIAFAVKQSCKAGLEIVASVMESLNFTLNVMPSAESWVGQLLGGRKEQVRLFQEIGYAYTQDKKNAAAQVISRDLSAEMHREERAAIKCRMQELRSEGVAILTAAKVAGKEFNTSPSTAFHLLYRAGKLRTSKGWKSTEDTLGECYWSPVVSLEDKGVSAETYDVVTEDPEQAFIASGITVHNCGNKAVRTDIRYADIVADDAKNGTNTVAAWMNSIAKRIGFGVGRPNNEPVDHPVLQEVADHADQFIRNLAVKAGHQLGTVGAGNHYVDLFEGDDGFVWIGVHFGSRGLGHTIASQFINDNDGMFAAPSLLALNTDEGQAYVNYMELGGRYAYAGRDVVVSKVLEILGNPKVTHEVHNHHNYSWSEDHFVDGRLETGLWVVRKGATPLFPNQQGFVGGSMGENAVIIEGVGNDTSYEAGRGALWSAPHGAGRAMSRSEAKGKHKKRWTDGKGWVQPHGEAAPTDADIASRGLKKRWVKVADGRVNWAEALDDLKEKGIELRGGEADEAPKAYKRLPQVLDAHSAYVKVVHQLRPIGVAMAGEGTTDPYKD